VTRREVMRVLKRRVPQNGAGPDRRRPGRKAR
jgi:hypothetical protein